jgi:hypothetical protein
MAKRCENAKYFTEKYKSILRSCKYCGNKDIRIASDPDGWSVVCMTKSCDCTAIYTSVKKAVEVWNAKQTTDISIHKNKIDEIVEKIINCVDINEK